MNETPAMRRTCTNLRIPHTLSALFDYLTDKEAVA